MASIAYCYVGCNTGSPDKQAIHVLECDTETGIAKIVQSVKGFEGTTYFQFDKEGKFLYSVIGEKRDTKSVGAAVRFPIDGWRLGAMERLCELPCEAPSLRTYVFPDDAMGPNKKRQKKAYAHQTFNVAGLQGCKVAGLGVVDLGCDRIRFFDPTTMREAEIPDIQFDAGDGPRHAIFSKDGKFLFVLCELGSCVYSFAVSQPCDLATLQPCNPVTFTRLGRWSMLPEGYDRWEADGETLNTKAAAIKLTKDGKILMASNRGYDSIAFYAVGEDGTLALKNIAKLRGKFPRDFELMPGEKFMVVGHKMSNEIQVYRFDREACTLEPVGEPIAAWRPLCFKFLTKNGKGW